MYMSLCQNLLLDSGQMKVSNPIKWNKGVLTFQIKMFLMQFCVLAFSSKSFEESLCILSIIFKWNEILFEAKIPVTCS